MLLIKNGQINTMTSPEVFEGDILVDAGKIVSVGKDIAAPEGCEIYDASGKQVYPGFIDAHTHLGLDGWAVDAVQGHDYNEMNDITACGLRAIDGINPMDITLRDAARAGVTSVCTGPGSANVLGGTFTAIKTVGKRIDNMIIKKEVAMKCAFGENPKRCYKDKTDSCRMTTAAKLREMLFLAREYARKLDAAGDDESKKPAFNMKLEALLPVIRGEIPLKAHAHRADDIFTAIRIAKEFGVKLTLEHCTEGHLIADELAKEGYPAAVGPTLGQASKYELRNKSFTTPGVLQRAGISVSIITDSSVIPQQYLPICAGLAVKAGMDRYEALKAITINPARHIGIEDRVGTLEAGKDADIVICSGDPLFTDSSVDCVFINGEKVE